MVTNSPNREQFLYIISLFFLEINIKSGKNPLFRSFSSQLFQLGVENGKFLTAHFAERETACADIKAEPVHGGFDGNGIRLREKGIYERQKSPLYLGRRGEISRESERRHFAYLRGIYIRKNGYDAAGTCRHHRNGDIVISAENREIISYQP